MKRIKVLVAAIAVVAIMLPSVALAESPGGYITRSTWQGATESWPWYDINYEAPDGIVDPDCGTSRQIWKVILYEHRGFVGARVTICGVHNEGQTGDPGINGEEDFCQVPLFNNNPPRAGCVLSNNAIAHVSSIKVISQTSGSCIRFFKKQDYNDASFAMVSGQNMADLPSGFNDTVKSMKRIYSGQC